jgi:hypothetical protein
VISKVNGKVQYPQPACWMSQRSSRPERPNGILIALEWEDEAVLTLCKFPRHIDVVVEERRGRRRFGDDKTLVIVGVVPSVR